MKTLFILLSCLLLNSCAKDSGCELMGFTYTLGKERKGYGRLCWVDSTAVREGKYFSYEDCQRVAMQKIRNLKDQEVTIVYRGVSPFRIEHNYHKLYYCSCR